jgi:hypothetical protein
MNRRNGFSHKPTLLWSFLTDLFWSRFGIHQLPHGFSLWAEVKSKSCLPQERYFVLRIVWQTDAGL